MFHFFREAKEHVLLACDRIASDSENKINWKFGHEYTVNQDGKKIPLHEFQKERHEKYVMELYNDLENRFK